MSNTPITIIGPIIIKLNKKYGLIKLSSKIAAIDTIDDVIKICLTLIFLNFGRLRAFLFLPWIKSKTYLYTFKGWKHLSNQVFLRLFYEPLNS